MAEPHAAKPVHPLAAQGFGSAGDAYERARPSYPAEAVAALLAELGSGGPLLDLAAGTGKLTRLLWHAAPIVAVEPVEGMRRKLSALLDATSPRPDVRVLAGTAEAIPLPAHSVAGAAVGQAFHWFHGAEALAEIHRVLQPEGKLALLWNVREEAVEWVARFSAIIHRHAGDAPSRSTSEWRRPFEGSELFGPLRERRFTHEHVLEGPEALADRAASISYIAALDAATRAEVLAEVRDLATTHPALRGQRSIRMPYVTALFVADALDDGGY
jgi:SAM-dependent methyltransferase